MGNSWGHETGRKSIYGVCLGVGGDTNWRQVKGINEWAEQKNRTTVATEASKRRNTEAEIQGRIYTMNNN